MFPTSTRKFTQKSEIFRQKTSHMVLSIIFLEDKHKIVLHLSIFYEYQHFFQHRICFSIQPPDYSDPLPTLARSTSFFLIMLFNYIIWCESKTFTKIKHTWNAMVFIVRNLVSILDCVGVHVARNLVLFIDLCFYFTVVWFNILIVSSFDKSISLLSIIWSLKFKKDPNI